MGYKLVFQSMLSLVMCSWLHRLPNMLSPPVFKLIHLHLLQKHMCTACTSSSVSKVRENTRSVYSIWEPLDFSLED